MSDQKSFSPIDLFKAPASTSVGGQPVFGDTNKGNSFDLSFSRELSMASERAVSARKSSQASRSGDPGTGERKALSRSQEPQRTHTNTTTRTSARESSNHSDGEGNIANKDEDPLKTETDTRTQSGQNMIAESKSSDKAVRSGLDGENAEGTEQQVSANVKDLLLPETDLAGGNNAQVDSLRDSEVTETTDMGIPDSPGIEVAGLNVDAITAVKATETSVSPVPSALQSGISGAKRLQAGEQLSPGQLANRQAHLLNNASAREKASVALTNEIIAEDMPDADKAGLTTRSATASSMSIGGFVDLQKEKGQKLPTSNVRLVDGVLVKSSAIQADNGEIPASQAEAKGLQLADAASSANSRTVSVNQKNEQQTLTTNLTQSLQLAQQQAQSLNLATTAINAEPLDKLAQSSDNTFLSLQGGIVTAPSVSRPDTGLSQNISAPLNLPILQNDADKAMAGNIRWMVNEGVKNAVVNVTPSGMGPISVTIGIEKDQMNVSIVALQGSTREALDSMLPRLREQLAAQGHDSVRVDISDGQAEQSAQGYGQRFDDGPSGKELMSGDEKHAEDSDTISDSREHGASDGTQGFITTIDAQGQITSRYDVYV